MKKQPSIKSINLANTKSNLHWVDITDSIKFQIDYPSIDQDLLLQEVMMDDTISSGVRRLKYARLYVKYVIKGWKGVPEKFDLVVTETGTEMEDELWKRFVSDSVQLMSILSILIPKLEFKENDKKK